MNMKIAVDALERGCCLEVYYGKQSVVIDPQIAGFDSEERPILLGVERLSEHAAPLARWLLIRLDEKRMIDVCGYMSDGPRDDCGEGQHDFARILCRAQGSSLT